MNKIFFSNLDFDFEIPATSSLEFRGHFKEYEKLHKQNLGRRAMLEMRLGESCGIKRQVC